MLIELVDSDAVVLEVIVECLGNSEMQFQRNDSLVHESRKRESFGGWIP